MLKQELPQKSVCPACEMKIPVGQETPGVDGNKYCRKYHCTRVAMGLPKYKNINRQEQKNKNKQAQRCMSNVKKLEPLKVRLISNFWDYYDHWFDGYGAELTFERKSTGGMTRQEMLEYFQSLGFVVPVFGKPAKIYDQVPTVQYVVIHLDENAHCGEGKIKIPIHEAIQQYPEHLAVQHIPTLPNNLGQSCRYLQIGDKIFWLEYTSQNDWRSNYGDNVQIRILSHKDGYHPQINYPLFAIDFVLIQNVAYAIDFNVAPGVRGTGIENILPATTAAETIKKTINQLHTIGGIDQK